MHPQKALQEQQTPLKEDLKPFAYNLRTAAA